MTTLAVGLAVFVGVALGLLGGGGSILTVPLLAYVAGMDAKQAITTSLLVVGVTSVVGSVSHARADRTRWRVGLIFGAAGMVGAFGGGTLSRFIASKVLLVGFAVMMVATAIAMMRGRRNVRVGEGRRLSLPKILLQALAVGFVTGLVGAGGGFIVVPALALLGGLPMPVAVGTSLVVIAMNSFAGLAGHLTSVRIDWPLALVMTAAAVVGALIGARVTSMINPESLRKAFGWFVLLISSLILAQEIHPVVGVSAAALTVVAALMTLACSHYAYCPLRRRLRIGTVRGVQA
ncbi:sulfite exporter TauE/SafE family protein [Mycolicibacterium goodii]|uniref:sulfite exporter TauE/SafE family protein n=1 Tax=Mycolicibacterium goodii TaxID=134601 RepID=UPI001BDCCE39|nr:sulfite exporter TauE/SafE family protein [Mycolicibacterium goodii]MBU8807453.1 sulfite exporter TauE/SafE family protein [Mycolicibacterium goodii]ULN47699.1 sulfite exporter TauE/SafE family protein [Mycolicibacterium goodii]